MFIVYVAEFTEKKIIILHCLSYFSPANTVNSVDIKFTQMLHTLKSVSSLTHIELHFINTEHKMC